MDNDPLPTLLCTTFAFCMPIAGIRLLVSLDICRSEDLSGGARAQLLA